MKLQSLILILIVKMVLDLANATMKVFQELFFCTKKTTNDFCFSKLLNVVHECVTDVRVGDSIALVKIQAS